MVTASHLTQEMNGIELCRENAIPLSGDEGLPALQHMVGEMPGVRGNGRVSRQPVVQNRGIDRFIY